MSGSAVISGCGAYRYRLERQWGNGPMLPVIMLNPSTADASINDPTIRRCISFADREGYGSIVVLNLYAFRATSPEVMKAAPDPMGPDNLSHLEDAIAWAGLSGFDVLAAWGSSADGKHARDLATKHGARLVCLGTTKGGHPRHPLYVRGDQPFIPLAPATMNRKDERS